MALINRIILAHENGILFVLIMNHHIENCRAAELQTTHSTLWKTRWLHWAMYHCAFHGLLGMKNNRALGFPVVFASDFSEEKATNTVAAEGSLPCRRGVTGPEIAEK